MNMKLGLIISDNNDTAFKSKSRKESHNVFGQSIMQWSTLALHGITQNIESIYSQDVEKCKDIVSTAKQIIINWADQPLVSNETVENLYKKHIAEANEATAIFDCEGRASVYVFESQILSQKLKELDILNLSRDVLKQIFQSVKVKNKYTSEDKSQLVIVDDRIALSVATSEIKVKILREIMLSGVTIVDPASTYIDFGVQIGEDTIIMPNTIIQGDTAIGEDCIIGPNSRICSCKIGNNVEVANSVANDSSVGDDTHIGPFAYIRPGSVVGSHVKIGDFVEVKKSVIGDKTKISHLTYVGDAEVGSNVNIGCGVVFVNYDGKNKNKTVVGDNSFIGCNVNLVSPVVVNKDAYIAAGSTITDEVPENSLAIARERQVIKQDWVTKKDLKRK